MRPVPEDGSSNGTFVIGDRALLCLAANLPSPGNRMTIHKSGAARLPTYGKRGDWRPLKSLRENWKGDVPLSLFEGILLGIKTAECTPCPHQCGFLWASIDQLVGDFVTMTGHFDGDSAKLASGLGM